MAAVTGVNIDRGARAERPGTTKKRQVVIPAALSAVVTLGSFAAVAVWMDPAHIVDQLSRGHRGSLALAFALFALANVFKSERLRRLTPEAAAVSRTAHLSMVCLYNLVSSLVPAGLGEASYPAMLRIRHGARLSAGLSAVLVTRVLDLVVVAGCALVALWAPSAQAPWRGWITLLLAGIVMIAAIAIPSARNSRRVRHLWSRLTGRLEDTAAQPLYVAREAWRARASILLLTAACWGCGYACAWVLAAALGLPLDLPHVVEGNSLALLMSALPLKGALGFGTQHVGWVAGLAVFGWSAGDALAVAIPIHLVSAAFTILLGALGWVLGLPHSAPNSIEGAR